MTINENENIVLVDVDNTLILYDGEPDVTLDYYGQLKDVRIHRPHRALIKAYKARGFFIRVHSNNGYKWAKEVVDKLGLENYVDSIEAKATRFVDDADLGSNEVIGQKVYIPYE